jgi:hypothetical protein
MHICVCVQGEQIQNQMAAREAGKLGTRLDQGQERGSRSGGALGVKALSKKEEPGESQVFDTLQ